MTFEQRYNKAREHLIAIDNIIYAKGAPLDSPEYFEIRKIAARYEREKHNDENRIS